ncbi:L,D-transpeptidase family protein [Hydrogenivirga sp.]
MLWLRVLTLLTFLTVVFAGHPEDLERGNLLGAFKRFIEGKATDYDLYILKSLAQDIKEEPPEYVRFFARGLIAERRGDLESAIENYLKSIELKSDYNPSYFRFNALIRKVEHPEEFRRKMTDIIWNRFSIPPPVIVENPEDKYVFLVEKMSQYLLIYKGKVLENLYPVTTGQDWEDKWVEGDKRTPEGIYYFTKFIPPRRLPKMYGGIAVVLNYPNPVDRLLGKGGSGIWLHGSDEENRYNIPFSTRGCVVADNNDLKHIVKRIAKNNTLIAIYKEIPTDIETDDVIGFLNRWESSWENKDVETYLSLYSKRFTWKRGGYNAWKRYKKRVIGNKRIIEVEMKDLTVLAFRRGLSESIEYYVAEFTQVYRSDNYSDRGFKRLYIIKENGELKIVKEEFRKDRKL